MRHNNFIKIINNFRTEEINKINLVPDSLEKQSRKKKGIILG
jgi:hypothetical protein